MQEDIRFTLFIIGIAVIGGVLLHGIWTIRKNSKKSTRASFESKNWEPGFEHEDDLDADVPLYDDVGVGKARVVFNPKSEQKENDEPLVDPIEKVEASAAFSEAVNNSDDENAFKQNVGAGQIGEGEEYSLGAREYPQNKAESETLASPVPMPKENEFDTGEQNNKAEDAERTTLLNGDMSKTDSLQSDKAHTEVESNTKPEVKVAPMYSNVVTQPKPEFHKPSIAKDILSEDIGQPPEFLLKKQSDEPAEEAAPLSAETSSEDIDKPSEPVLKQTSPSQTAPAVEPIYETPIYSGDEKAPEFSLHIQEGPEVLTKESNKPGVEKELSFAEQAKRFVRRNKKSVSDKLRKEPVIKDSEEDQMHIDFDKKESKPIVREEQLDLIGHDHHHIDDKPKEPIIEKEAYTGDPVVLVLNVKADKSKPIEGAALLPMLLTLGFKFGEHEIFHRHVNTDGKGPILFSLANMLKPGNFDIDNIENFSTLGLSLFMMLPIEGDAQQVFNMMHNAARKLSEEFDCKILDGNKVVLSKQSVQQYVERIREFERKRLSR